MAKSQKLLGRDREKQILQSMLDSNAPEFLALYGRRRVGKTHLIREFFKGRNELTFSVTGQKDAPQALQLNHFQTELERAFYNGAPLPRLNSWEQAFDVLCTGLEKSLSGGGKKKAIIFLDELPWLATSKSGLLQSLDYAWNTRLNQLSEIKLIVCGSAASWMLDKLINAKGGLHNRITRRIRLEPFSLGETRDYLRWRGLNYSLYQLLELYMALGGIPFYLNNAEKGDSAAQNIARICFEKNGPLSDEFERLFISLFSAGKEHEKIIRAIANKREGILRNELINVTGASSGGRFNHRLKELEEAGFISSFIPWGSRKKNISYRLIDEYSAFYLKWIEPAGAKSIGDNYYNFWSRKATTPAYWAWAGYSFENICLKHAGQVRKALGLDAVASEAGTWRHVSKKNRLKDKGAQIDLLFDRADGAITLCEIKYHNRKLIPDRTLATELKDKIEIFQKITSTKKQIFMTLITLNGAKSNAWSDGLIDKVVSAEDLFGK